MRRVKRSLCILLILCMLVGLMPVAAFAANDNMPFTDVKESDWFYESVKYVYDNQLMLGTGETTFSPGATITRGMIVTILHRMEGKPTATAAGFPDVAAGRYCTEAVLWASANGIVKGYENGNFGPDDAITREQLAAILYRYMQYKGYDVSADGAISGFADASEVSAYAVEALNWAVGAGVVKGTKDNKLAPKGNATRAEAATMLMRFCENVVPETYTVTFNYNYDGKTAVVSVLEGKTVEEPAAPERADFTFGGWYTDADGKTAYDFGKAVTENVTLYAKWTANEPVVTPEPSVEPTPEPSVEPTPEVPKSYTVSFDYNYDEKGTYKEAAVEEGAAVGKPDDPSRSNYVFMGWTTDKLGLNSFDFSTPITSDMTLYAQWKANSSSTTVPTVRRYTVTFESNGGSEVESQTVKRGGQVAEPDCPTREGFLFMGWYQAPGYSEMYDFSSKVYSNVVLYAKWYDTVNTVDSDNDGLSDALEIEMGTDPNNADTDGDGLSDYTELNWLNYNPLSDDTDGNGILDKDEDPDNDGLTNEVEEKLGTNPIFKDSDFDGLSDGEEVNVYHTDPLKADTDGDGVSDGVEIMIGTDPLVAETTFATKETSGTVDKLTPVAAAAVVNTDAEGAGTLRIQSVSILDNSLLSYSVAGYLGSAYDFSTKGTFQSATITFTYDTALGTIGENFQPRIYYYNEETQLLEELPNQTVEEGQVSASVEHFSTYVLLNKVEFDKVWENDIKPPQEQSAPQYTGIDIVFVIDSSGSMTSNDSTGLRKEAAKAFVDKLGENDRAAVIEFDSSATVYQAFTSDHESLKTAINKVDSYGGTSLSAGINTAIGLFTGSDYTRTDAYKYIIFLTDGDGSYSVQYTETASNNNIVIYTIGLGSGVREAVLKSIADGTGGKYYFASTADALSGIYVDVSYETIDYTTDSNNDGISDYYTKLLNEGKLLYGTTTCNLVGVIDMYGEDCDDWDGDGLKNGEELIITTTADGRVYVKMISNPLLVDTDGDGFSDKVEKDLGLPPMKYTILGDGDLRSLENDNQDNGEKYEYAQIANEDKWYYDVYYKFSFQRKEIVKQTLINYFYDYASEESIARNAEKIAEQAELENKLVWFDFFQKAANIAKNIYSLTEDLSELNDGIDTDDRQEKISAVLSKAERTGNLIEIASSSTVKWINRGDTFSSILELVNEIQEESDGLKNEIESLDVLGFDVTLIEKVTDGCVKLVTVVKTIPEVIKFMTSDFGYTAISDVYNGFLKSKGFTANSWIGIGVDVVDGAVEIKDTAMTYGKMKANVDAYRSYTELLYYVSKDGYEDFIRGAAKDIADIVKNNAWDLYDKQLCNALRTTVALTAIKTAYNVAADVSPYVKLVKVTTDIIKAAIKLSGKDEEAMILLYSKTLNSVSRGCVSIIDSKVQHNQGHAGLYFSLDRKDLDDVNKYMTQLAQSRIVGINYILERRLKHDLASDWSNWEHGDKWWQFIEQLSDEEIKDLYSTKIVQVYNMAHSLNLKLSNKLPFYDEYGAQPI